MASISPTSARESAKNCREATRHVFADTQVSGVDDVLHNWEQIKRAEPEHKESRKSALDGVPKAFRH